MYAYSLNLTTFNVCVLHVFIFINRCIGAIMLVMSLIPHLFINTISVYIYSYTNSTGLLKEAFTSGKVKNKSKIIIIA